MTWEQISSLSGTRENDALCRVAEHVEGERFIKELAEGGGKASTA